MIQDMQLILERYAGCQQLGERANNPRFVQIPFRIVIFTHYQDAGVVPGHG